MHAASRALPSFAAMRAAERCGCRALSGAQPGGLAQGPEEKCGRAGRAAGLGIRHFQLSSQRARAALGRRGPLQALAVEWRQVESANFADAKDLRAEMTRLNSG